MVSELGLCVHIQTLSIHFSAVIGLRWSTRQTDVSRCYDVPTDCAGRPARQTCLDVTMYRLTALVDRQTDVSMLLRLQTASIASTVPNVRTYFLHGITRNTCFFFILDFRRLWLHTCTVGKYRRESKLCCFYIQYNY